MKMLKKKSSVTRSEWEPFRGRPKQDQDLPLAREKTKRQQYVVTSPSRFSDATFPYMQEVPLWNFSPMFVLEDKR
jgi:hypothetical protein